MKPDRSIHAPTLTFFGQLETPLPPAELAAALAGAEIAAEVRESSHYAGGTYLRVRTGDAADFTLERLGEREYVARADADHGDALAAIAQRVSAALARLGIRHRFELYDDEQQLMRFLRHDGRADLPEAR